MPSRAKNENSKFLFDHHLSEHAGLAFKNRLRREVADNPSDGNDARLLVAGSVGGVAIVGFVCTEGLKKGTIK